MKRVLVLVLTLVMVIGLAGVADTSITLAEEPEDVLCAECGEKGPDEGMPGITQAGCSTSDGGLMESGEGYIIMDVDCWHKGGGVCRLCDEVGDYDCAFGGWEPWGPCCFSDLVPEGNIVTKIEAEWRGTHCSGGKGLSVYINDTLLGSGTLYGTCACDVCYPVTVTSANYLAGFPGYVYGGTNELWIDVTGDACLSDVHLKIYYYEPNIPAILERLAAVHTKLYDEVQPRLDDLEAKDVELQATDEEIEGRVADLEAENEELEGRVADLEAENEDLEGRVTDLEAENEELENRLAAVETKLHEEVQPRLDALEAAEGCVKAVVDWLIEHVIPSGLINQAEKKGYPMPECP